MIGLRGSSRSDGYSNRNLITTRRTSMTFLEETREILSKVLRPFLPMDKRLIAERVNLGRAASLTLESSAFNQGGPIPKLYSGEGENISPPLAWGPTPLGTQELLLVCEDPDAPSSQPFLHWVAYHISPQLDGLPENIPKGRTIETGTRVAQAVNDRFSACYTGPLPPVGHGPHHYHFQLFALRKPLRLDDDPGRDEILEAIDNNIIAFGELIGTYER